MCQYEGNMQRIIKILFISMTLATFTGNMVAMNSLSSNSTTFMTFREKFLSMKYSQFCDKNHHFIPSKTTENEYLPTTIENLENLKAIFNLWPNEENAEENGKIALFLNEEIEYRNQNRSANRYNKKSWFMSPFVRIPLTGLTGAIFGWLGKKVVEVTFGQEVLKNHDCDYVLYGLMQGLASGLSSLYTKNPMRFFENVAGITAATVIEKKEKLSPFIARTKHEIGSSLTGTSLAQYCGTDAWIQEEKPLVPSFESTTIKKITMTYAIRLATSLGLEGFSTLCEIPEGNRTIRDIVNKIKLEPQQINSKPSIEIISDEEYSEEEEEEEENSYIDIDLEKSDND